MNIVEQSVGEWSKKQVTEDELVEMIKKDRGEHLEQSWNEALFDIVNDREQFEKKWGWLL